MRDLQRSLSPARGLDWDVLYPKANIGHAREILKSGGTLLSEFKPDQKATDFYFPAAQPHHGWTLTRYLVIEANEKSGSLSPLN